MNLKMFSAAFVFLLAIHASQQQPQQSGLIASIFARIAEILLDLADDSLNVIVTVFDNIDKNIPKIEKDLVHGAIQLATDLNKVFLDILNDLKSNATHEEKKVICCIEEEKDNVNSALRYTANKIGHCAGKDISLVINATLQVIKSFQPLIEKLKIDVESLKICSDTYSDIKCLTNFALNELVILQKIASIVIKDLEEIIKVDARIIQNFISCSLELDKALSNEVYEIFTDIATCTEVNRNTNKCKSHIESD
ncbi:hypothetical protein ABEB36_004122 [Hypothenemus hampei]|uniref:Uncharacterized protein n=1 Tax=Hypothenemus hampei TaxID=57062 RepID=A0ABD1F299_HYPHA